LKALSIKPPIHPWFPKEWEQETSYYSENSARVPVVIAALDSVEATVEKAQHDPHDPWFLTSVTFPLSTQLTAPTKEVSS